jgi:HPt (histidine-containing phosphotransfer) domain-containing protein
MTREAAPSDQAGMVGADLDHSIIDELRVLGGTELVDDIVSLVREDMSRSLGLLDRALVDDDASSVVRFAHTISGLCANIGAVGVVEVAKELENLASTGELSAAPVLNDQLVARWYRANEVLGTQTGLSGPG